jgi:hypothetical protein
VWVKVVVDAAARLLLRGVLLVEGCARLRDAAVLVDAMAVCALVLPVVGMTSSMPTEMRLGLEMRLTDCSAAVLML